jgi:hypothetical protein
MEDLTNPFPYYCSLWSISIVTKWIILFFKNEFIFKFWIIKFSIIYYDICDMSSEIIQSATYDNYNDFQHVNFIFFTKFHFTIFTDYLMTKLTLG